MKNRKLVLAAIVGVTLLLLAAPALGQAAPPISDSMTVYNAAGAIVAQTLAFEDGNEDPATIYTVAVGIDPSQFGNPTVLLEANGQPSDIFGVCNPGTGQLTLCFNSDSELAGPNFGSFPLTFPEGNGVFDATMYLSPDLRASGYTAQFISDSEVPEPASLLLLGSGLMGLAGRVRRKISK